jgi:hypothetical protein
MNFVTNNQWGGLEWGNGWQWVGRRAGENAMTDLRDFRHVAEIEMSGGQCARIRGCHSERATVGGWGLC